MPKFSPLSLAVAVLVLGGSNPAWAQDVGTGFEVESYDVDLRPDLDTGAVSGRETIKIRITSPGIDELRFSPNSLGLSGAEVDGVAVEARSDEGAITFSLGREMPNGAELSLSFDFAGIPERGLTITPAGLYAGYFACDWMVCLQDAPGDKAAFALDLFLPRGKQSLGVGRQFAKLEVDSDLSLHRLQSEGPTSPYLFSFAAGDFEQYVQDTPQGQLRYFNGTGEDVDLADVFADTPAMVAFLTDRAGVGLPDGGYSQVLVPGREAQETMSFSLVGKREMELEEEPSDAWVTMHELAHQWWGNRVTTRTWRDFWLNEGFATYMVAAWKQHRYGEAAYQAELDVFRDRRRQLQERGYDKPLTWTGQYPSLGYRRAVQYSKGALFLAVLRDSVGDEAFWKGIKSYTIAHLDDTVVTRDFQVAMEQASSRDLTPLFDEWAYGSVDDASPDGER